MSGARKKALDRAGAAPLRWSTLRLILHYERSGPARQARSRDALVFTSDAEKEVGQALLALRLS